MVVVGFSGHVIAHLLSKRFLSCRTFVKLHGKQMDAEHIILPFYVGKGDCGYLWENDEYIHRIGCQRN